MRRPRAEMYVYIYIYIYIYVLYIYIYIYIMIPYHIISHAIIMLYYSVRGALVRAAVSRADSSQTGQVFRVTQEWLDIGVWLTSGFPSGDSEYLKGF